LTAILGAGKKTLESSVAIGTPLNLHSYRSFEGERIMLRLTLIALFACACIGCGGVDEIPPATTTPEGPPPEVMQDKMKESMEKSGMGGQYRVPPKQ